MIAAAEAAGGASTVAAADPGLKPGGIRETLMVLAYRRALPSVSDERLVAGIRKGRRPDGSAIQGRCIPWWRT